MKKIILLLIISAFTLIAVFSQEKTSISGVIDWEAMEIKSTVSLDLASAGVKLPTGRTHAESLLADGYTRLIRQGIYELQIDSSSTVADLLEKNSLTLPEIDTISFLAKTVSPSLSPDLQSMSSFYTIPVSAISNALQRHTHPAPVIRTLNPVTTANYTGIIIIASEILPAHGLKSSFLPVPCLFPKIWDSEMNLIFDRTMVEPRLPVVRYFTPQSVLFNTPSGLSPELQQIVGDRPLRIFARGVFGIKPTDLIIDRTDALQIISSDVNRRLLTQGKVVIILDESVLQTEF